MKYIFHTLALFALFLLMGLIGAHFYFTPTRLQTLIQPRLEETLQRNVSLKNVQLHYGLEPSIVIDDLHIQDHADFSNQAFFTAEQAHLSLSPFAFLFGQSRIGTLHLTNSHIHIIQNIKGKYNTSDLMRPKQIRIPINQIRLTNTTLVYHNLKWAQTTTTKIQSATLLANQNQKGIALSGETNIQNFTIQKQNRKTQGMALNFAYDAIYTPQTQQASITKLALDLGPILTHLAGHINVQKQTIDLKSQNKTLDLARIKNHLIEQSLLSSQATLSGEGLLDLHISGNAWPPNITGQLKATHLALADPNRLKNPIINGDIHLNIDNKNLRLNALTFQSGLSDVRISGVISKRTSRPHLSFAWVSNTVDIDGFLPPPKTAQTQWSLVPHAYAAPNTKKSALISILNNLDMDGSIRADSLRVQNTWIQNLRTTVHAQDGTLNIKPITGQTHQGALNGTVSFTTFEQGAQLESTLSIINGQAHPLFNQTLGWHIPLYGNFTLTAHLQSALDTTLTHQRATTKATGRFHMQAGKLVQWDVLQNNLKSVEQLGLLTADEVPLQDATLIFNLQGNILTLNGTQLTAANMACRVHGTGDLAGTLQYAIDVDVPPSRIQFGGFNLGALLGGRTIPVRIHVGGTARAPHIRAGLQ